ncbi:hypothetical protein [Halalkalibacter oceani]|uniref:hypothetical protein n=1 Tax=Halalkalibacter oceani TaxID=1653776 RepID=UPI003397BF26
MGKRADVAYANYDIIFRSMTEQFREKALDFYGINTAPIVRVVPTDLPIITVNDRRMDFMFLLKDDTYLHLEFQTVFSEKELDRFLQYDVSAYEKYKKPIQTVVIYGADVDHATEVKKYGSVTYETKAVFMKDYDGDQIILDLWTKIENGEELTDVDELNLIFLPLMKSIVDRSERAIETVELAKRIKNQNQQVKLMSTIIAISDKFIDEEYVEKLMEVASMARVLRMAEERAERRTRIQTHQEDIKEYLDSRFGLESKSMQDAVEQITEIDVLKMLLRDLYRAETRKEMTTLIQEALEKQERWSQSAE